MTHENKPASPSDNKVLLSVGIGLLPAEGMASLQEDGLTVVARQYSALTPHLLTELRPTCILIPLFGTGFDAGHAVQRLQGFGYRGLLRILCPKLPNPAMVLKELNQMAPDIEIELFTLPGI